MRLELAGSGPRTLVRHAVDRLEAAIYTGEIAAGARASEQALAQRFSIGRGALREAVRTLEASLGQATVGPTAAELASRHGFRLSCVAAKPLPAGWELTAGDVAFRRPGSGLPPKAIEWLLGRKISMPVPAGHVFDTGDFIQ